MQQIVRWDTGTVIHAGDYPSLCECVEDAVRRGVDLCRARLVGASLGGASLGGAIWCDGITLRSAPVQAANLRDGWPVWVLDEHMQIGCKLHTFAEWRAFTDRDIAAMGGARALRFWHRYGAALLALCAAREQEGRA